MREGQAHCAGHHPGQEVLSLKKKKKSRLSQPRGGSAAPWLMPQFLPRVPALTSLKVINLNKPSPPQVGFGPDAFSWQQKH